MPITRTVSLSLSGGVFPHQFRHSIVTPLIKKPSLPRNDLKNYRPVSGLNFISKVIERVVAYQVKEYLSHNNLNNIYQSAYKSGHSTETTLLKIKNDIHLSLAEGKPTANSIIALITWLHVTGIVYQIMFDWPHQFQLFVRGSKLISFGKPFLLHKYTFLIGWISWIMTYFIIYEYSILDAP